MRFGVMQAILGLKTEDAITAAGEVGFDGIQLVVGSDYFQNPLWTEEGAIQIARRADRAVGLAEEQSGVVPLDLHQVVAQGARRIERGVAAAAVVEQ